MARKKNSTKLIKIRYVGPAKQVVAAGYKFPNGEWVKVSEHVADGLKNQSTFECECAREEDVSDPVESLDNLEVDTPEVSETKVSEEE